MNRNHILNLLKQYKKNNYDKYGIENIGIFGSVARDEATDLSDYVYAGAYKRRTSKFIS